MKRFIKDTLSDRDVEIDNFDLEWQTKESPQTLRNTGRIEQLEAGQADSKEQIKQLKEILSYYLQSSLQSSQWRTPKSSGRLSWRKFVNMPDINSELKKALILRLRASTARTTVESTSDQLKLPYHEKLSTLTTLLSELEKDFDDIPRRITRCAVLEEELATFEDSLEDEKEEYLASCVSLIRDVLDYNYAEDLTQTHLEILKKAVDLICDKVLYCSKEDYQNLHREFLQSGLALLPTSRKAIDKYELTKANDGV